MPEPTDVLSTDSGTAARNSAEEVNGRSSSSSDQSEMDSWLLEFIDKQYFMRNLLEQKDSKAVYPVKSFPFASIAVASMETVSPITAPLPPANSSTFDSKIKSGGRVSYSPLHLTFVMSGCTTKQTILEKQGVIVPNNCRPTHTPITNDAPQ